MYTAGHFRWDQSLKRQSETWLICKTSRFNHVSDRSSSASRWQTQKKIKFQRSVRGGIWSYHHHHHHIYLPYQNWTQTTEIKPCKIKVWNATREATAHCANQTKLFNMNCNNIPFTTPFHGSAKRKCGFFPQHHGHRVNCRCNHNFVCLA